MRCGVTFNEGQQLAWEISPSIPEELVYLGSRIPGCATRPGCDLSHLETKWGCLDPDTGKVFFYLKATNDLCQCEMVV